ncbi:MAG: cysteine desulfurase [Verrucomicrobiota bacterium]|nr:cysteine desulfurase [Verrucomicrobiota bacterium]
MSAVPPLPPSITCAFPIEAIRAEFPILSQSIGDCPLIYLDNGATTQKPKAVLQALANYYTQDNANIHRGVHTLSQRATDHYEKARERIARYIHASHSREIIFVRGATEGINLIANTFGRTHLKAGDNIVITAMEHHANIVPWQLLAEQIGFEIRVTPCDERGVLDLEAYANLLDKRTRLVGVVHVSNSLGTVNPVASMIQQAHAVGAVFLLDAAQSIQHMTVDVQALDCDFLVFSGHKLYGPTGIGVLYGKTALLRSLPPWQGGGDMIKSVSFERTTYKDIPERFEAGTPDISGVIGLAAAIDWVDSVGRERIATYEKGLLDYATAKLAAISGIRLIGTAPDKSCVLSFLLGDVHPHDIGSFLDADGIAIRAGHHCTQPLMKRLCIPGTARATFALYNTYKEADRLAESVAKIAQFFKV